MSAARPRLRAWAVAAAIGLVAAGAAPAEAGQAPGPRVDIHSAAMLAPDGGSITVTVLASCPERWSVVDASVSVTQPQASGRASFPLTCIGSWRSFTVAVPSSGGTFDLQDAQVAASVVIKRGKTDRAQDADTVDVQPGVFVQLAETAQLVDGGAAALIDVTTACPVGTTGRQSNVVVSQNQTYGVGSYQVVCDGQRHTATVRAALVQGSAFQTGNANALTFADVDENGTTFTGVDEGPIQIVS